MVKIRYAAPADGSFWFSLDRHIAEREYEHKMREKQGYIIEVGGQPVGIMRYNLFWDEIPFLTLIYLAGMHRGKGLGADAVRQWEAEMRALGHKMLMTSTQADEQAQHFYRKLGFKDAGCLVLDTQPLEILMTKRL